MFRLFTLEHQCSSFHCPFKYGAEDEGELGLVGLRVYVARSVILENKLMSVYRHGSHLLRDNFSISKPLIQVGRACAPLAYL